jgi:hypothetical protein
LLPGEKSTPEEKAAFYAKLGRPETPDGYEITKPTDLPESIPYDPALASEFSKFAHANGLTKEQAKGSWDFYFNLAREGRELEIKAQNESVDKLKTEWGVNFAGNKTIAEIAFKNYGKEAVDLLNEAKIGSMRLGDHPAFLKVFHRIGLATMDDKILKGGGGGEQDPAQDDAKTANLMFPSMQKKE